MIVYFTEMVEMGERKHKSKVNKPNFVNVELWVVYKIQTEIVRAWCVQADLRVPGREHLQVDKSVLTIPFDSIHDLHQRVKLFLVKRN